MDIIMLQTHMGCEDGFMVHRYTKGVVYYDVRGLLASDFIRKGWARKATLQEMRDQVSLVQQNQ